MAKVELKIRDPQKLEMGTSEEPVQMTYGGTEAPVVLDTETAFVECEQQQKSAAIKDWVVDFDAHKMKLADEAGEGNYREIDFVLASGMVGQLLMQTGVPTLQKMLATLGSQYAGNEDSEKPDPQDPGNDAPKPSKSPSPFDEV